MIMHTTQLNRLRKEGGNYGPTGMENQDLEWPARQESNL